MVAPFTKVFHERTATSTRIKRIFIPELVARTVGEEYTIVHYSPEQLLTPGYVRTKRISSFESRPELCHVRLTFVI